MSSKVAWLILFASVAMPPAAVAQQDSGDGDYQTIQTDDLTLQVPADWTRGDDADTALTLLAPVALASEQFRDNVRVKKYPLRGIDDLDRIHAVQEKSVEETFEVIGSGVLTTSQPRITWLAIAEKRPDVDRIPAVKIDYLMVHQGYLYVLHCMCPTSRFDDRRPTFDAIARSVRFIGTSTVQQATAPQANGSPQPSEYEQGRTIGKYALYAMAAAVAAWVVMRGVRALRK